MKRDFAQRLRNRERILGYWTQLPVPAVQERVARHGWDYVCFDAQHGFHDPHALLNGLIAIDAGAALGGNRCAGLVRVASNDGHLIGMALDAGAQGVIVPMIESVDDARRAVAFCRYAPAGNRSYGPMRAGLRSGPRSADMNDEIACIIMIETVSALECIDEIAALDGVDGIYVGPADLMLALGGETAADPAKKEVFERALARVHKACASAGIAAGIHTMAGDIANARLAEGFTFATVSSDLNHLDAAAAAHLKAAQR
ncbi:HpcH/HpaI aldolase family protein [Halomonas dongshanensis]|uniref:Aldolase/citrate lyase family protein n=1 Tax=Halomonas dongshanensis TaxID=2890835 RepID=A0ABT2EEE4_9GAMM|nr:aldolase/citrate lyase family protein [Halomonas dongshanensis]MCS2609940.1 aldolase/citrate lyase family protein [Halomonas dongshanensis]